MFFQFGIGGVFGNANAGNLAANPTPSRFMTVQDVDVTIDQQLKELKGQYKFPDDVAPGEMKLTGKIGTGRIDYQLWNNLFFADSFATGEDAIALAEAHTVPASTPFTVTIAPPSSGTFVGDLGVQYSATGQPFTKVATVAAAGQYAISGGVYTFDSADASAGVLISYTYALTSGHTLTVNNQLMGYGPVFELWLAEPYQAFGGNAGLNGLHLYACRLSKLNQPFKRDDYLIIDHEFEAYPNAAGQVCQFFATT